VQKLKQRCISNSPTDISLICSTEALTLNSSKGVKGSEQSLKTCFNNSEANQSQHGGSSGLRVQNIVYVLNIRGKPLMPTTPQKANKLLKKGETKVVKRKPFTIQLNKATGEEKQKITLGIDIGYQNIGLSATTKKKELFAAEVQLRKDLVKLNSERRMYRRTRRGRLWHRKSRFLNRKKEKGWLARIGFYQNGESVGVLLFQS